MLQNVQVPPIPPQAPPPLPEPHIQTPYVYMTATWEYHRVQRSQGQSLTVEELNALGKEGWELVGISTGPDESHFYFKRPG